MEITPLDVINGHDPQLEKAVAVAMAQVQKNPVVPPKLPAFPVHPGKQEPGATNLVLPAPGSAFPLPQRVVATTTGKFAEYLGQFETPMGLLVFKEENGKFIGDAGGKRIELVPDPTVKDKFLAQTANVSMTFERDAGGKIIGLTVLIPSGREMKGKKVQ